MLTDQQPSCIIFRKKRIVYYKHKVNLVKGDYIAFISIDPYSDYFGLFGFYVNEKFRRKGIATRILSYIINHSDRPIKLWVIWDNKIAQQLYLKFGFRYVEGTDFSKYSWQMIYDKHTSVA